MVLFEGLFRVRDELFGEHGEHVWKCFDESDFHFLGQFCGTRPISNDQSLTDERTLTGVPFPQIVDDKVMQFTSEGRSDEAPL